MRMIRSMFSLLRQDPSCSPSHPFGCTKDLRYRTIEGSASEMVVPAWTKWRVTFPYLGRDRLRNRQPGSVHRRLDHSFEAHAGVDHQVVEPPVGPVLVVEAANIGRTAPVCGEQLLLGLFRMLRKLLLEPAHFAPHRGIDKDMEAVRRLC